VVRLVPSSAVAENRVTSTVEAVPPPSTWAATWIVLVPGARHSLAFCVVQ
jgi:hypothetical protein